jgi:pimeloyl-ACP methyl ester carboxylesterase
LTSETSLSLKVGRHEQARNIAIGKISGTSPGVVWLGGYRSDMTGTKAQVMIDWAQNNGHAAVRFDYSGHGKSDGEFTDGTISKWLEEALAVFDQHTNGPQILVGSSMGGWIALRMAQELQKYGVKQKLAGILLIAPAPDFTHQLMEPNFSSDQTKKMDQNGFISEPSEYSDEPNIITKQLIEDGRNNLVLKGIINTGCPVVILQGMKDPDVPYQHAMRLIDHLPSEDVTMTLVKDGDHRLSREQDLELLKRALDTLVD